MATKDQYDFFRSLYDEEERTSSQLEERAKVYLGIISAFLFAVILKAEEVRKSITTLNLPWWAILVEALILSAALLCVIFALRVRAVEAINDAESIIEDYEGEVPISDEEFFEDRIADFAVAASRNRTVNNETAVVLIWAGWILVLGMIWLLFAVVFALGRMK